MNIHVTLEMPDGSTHELVAGRGDPPQTNKEIGERMAQLHGAKLISVKSIDEKPTDYNIGTGIAAPIGVEPLT